ncbi:MAG TPA: hypothetical protein VF395_18940 [Polyangiaceae bacterium]
MAGEPLAGSFPSLWVPQPYFSPRYAWLDSQEVAEPEAFSAMYLPGAWG